MSPISTMAQTNKGERFPPLPIAGRIAVGTATDWTSKRSIMPLLLPCLGLGFIDAIPIGGGRTDAIFGDPLGIKLVKAVQKLGRQRPAFRDCGLRLVPFFGTIMGQQTVLGLPQSEKFRRRRHRPVA